MGIVLIWKWLFVTTVISQGSVATRLRCGGQCDSQFVVNFLANSTMEKFWKSVNICQSYGQKYRGPFFWLTVYISVCLSVCWLSTWTNKRVHWRLLPDGFTGHTNSRSLARRSPWTAVCWSRRKATCCHANSAAQFRFRSRRPTLVFFFSTHARQINASERRWRLRRPEITAAVNCVYRCFSSAIIACLMHWLDQPRCRFSLRVLF